MNSVLAVFFAKWSKLRKKMVAPVSQVVQHLFYLQKSLALNTDDILIFSLQDVFSGIKTQLLIPILLCFIIKNIFFAKGSLLWIFWAKINVTPPMRGGVTKSLVFLESLDHLATKNSWYRIQRGKMIFMSHPGV